MADDSVPVDPIQDAYTPDKANDAAARNFLSQDQLAGILGRLDQYAASQQTPEAIARQKQEALAAKQFMDQDAVSRSNPESYANFYQVLNRAPLQQVAPGQANPNFSYENTTPPKPIPATIARPAAQDSLAADQEGKIDGQLPSKENPYQKAIDDAMAPFAPMKQAVELGIKNGIAQGAETSAFMQQMANEQDTLRANDASDEANRREDLERKSAEIDKQINDVAKMKVDPNNFWAHKDTGDKILAGIALFLGAAGGVNGQGNTAVPVLNAAINRDIDAQKANIGNAQENLKNNMSVYARMMNQFHDDRLAAAAARAAAWQNAGLRLQSIAAKYQGPEAQAKGLMMLGQIQQQEQAARFEIQQRIMQMQPVTPNTNFETLSKDVRERSVHGLWGSAKDPATATEIQNTKTATDFAVKGLDRLMQLAGNENVKVPGTPEYKEAETLIAEMPGTLRSPLFGGNRPNEAEFNLISKMASDPTKFFSRESNNIVGLKTVKDRLIEKQNLALHGAGFMTDEDFYPKSFKKFNPNEPKTNNNPNALTVSYKK